VTFAIGLSAGLLTAFAVWGVILPFLRLSPAVASVDTVEPLEEERGRLLRQLRDLDDERASGALTHQDYVALRRESERRAISVLRALEAKGVVGAEAMRDVRRPRPARETERGLLRTVAPFVVLALVVAAAIPILAGSLRARSGDTPITGGNSGDALAFFVDRVREHPNDLAARLDLAQRYRDTGDTGHAVQQYLEVLKRDPRNPEAHANLGFLLAAAGRADEGLKQIDIALAAQPPFDEAYYFKGVVLLQISKRPADAATALRAYLAAEPFGSHRADAERLLREAEQG
jgi:tetratricopeptide (TPR) repeat protein